MKKKETHQIEEGLLPLKVPLDTLIPDQANTRNHTQRNIEAIQSSLQRFNQRTPLVVQKEGMVIRKGNGTFLAAKDLGWTHIAALVIEEEALEAVAYSITDNKTTDLSEFDWEALALTAKELQAGGVDLLELGWEGFELEPLLEAEWSPPEGEEEDPSGDGDSQGKHSVNFSDDQWPVIQQAIEMIQGSQGAEIKPARALELICEDFLAGPDNEG